jgi:signal transduction histidine kinase
MSTGLVQKISGSLKKRGGLYLVLILVFTIILIGTNTIIYQEGARLNREFEKQIIGLTRASTGYLVTNYDLYYSSAPTIKYQNIVNDFLAENNEVKRYSVFDTEGVILFDSEDYGKENSSVKVENNVLELSRKNELTSVKEASRIKYIISPYFEVWGAHRFSVLYYPSYIELDKIKAQFNLEIAIIGILLAGTILAIVALYFQREQSKTEKAEKERMKILDRQRQEFMMLAAHNLRTPLAAMKGYVSLFFETKLSKQQKEMIIPVDKTTEKLSGLVENIIAITNVLGDPDASAYRVDLRIINTVDMIIKSLRSVAAAKRVIIDTAGIAPTATAYVNERYAEHILRAVIENAIKFNKDGGKVKIAVSQTGDKALITISDEGIGIKISEKEKIFGGFHQGVNDPKDMLTYNYEGTGLGLYMSKLLTEFMEGKIWFESKLGAGTTFFIELPKRETPPS